MQLPIGVICVTLIILLFKLVIVTNISYKHACDPPLLPSTDLIIFFVCVASASVKQIDSAIT